MFLVINAKTAYKFIQEHTIKQYLLITFILPQESIRTWLWVLIASVYQLLN